MTCIRLTVSHEPMHAVLNEGGMRMLETTANAVDAEQAMLQFYRELDPLHLAPLWESLHNLVPAAPRSVAQPFGWSWERMRPMVLQAGGLISAARAERRVLVLENPALP